jgi:hypothetical protein
MVSEEFAMKTFSVKLVMTLVLLTIFLITLLPGCSQPQIPVWGFNPKLSISEPPVLEKPVKITLTFDSVIPKGNEDKELYYFARFDLLPDKYELISGDLEQRGRLVAGEKHALEAIIKSVQTGNGVIYGQVSFYDSPLTVNGTEEDVLFIAIYNDHADVSENQDLPKTSTEITTTYTTTTFTPETTSTNTVPPTSNTTIAPSLDGGSRNK